VATRSDKFALAFAIVFPTALTWVYFIWLAKSAATLQQTAYSIGKVIQFGFPMFWVIVVRRQRPKDWRPRRAGLVTGAVFGAAVVATMFAAYHFWLEPTGALRAASETIREKVAGLGINSVGKYFALGVFYAALHSLMEEYYWRWFVFGQLRRCTTLPVAVTISSLGFMAHHVVLLSHYFGWGSFLGLLFSLSVAIGGVAWAWLYHTSRSLYGPWLSHALVDAGIFLLGFEIVRSIL
jgi:hypothetical protein